MTYASDIQDLLDQRVKTTGWQIAQTVALGVMAACLALFGQACLARARPLFPFIEQNYAAWQSGYTLVLLAIGVMWVLAMLQKISFLQDCVQRLRIQQRLDEQYALRAQKAEAARLLQQTAHAEAVVAKALPLAARADKGTRRNKFDY